MKFKTLITINAAIMFITGMACIAMPARLLANYGVTLAPMGLVIYQFWGATLVGLGLLTWFARNVKETALQRTFALALFLTHGISCAIAIRGQYAGANATGWSTVAIYFLLALAFGYLVLRSRKLP